MNSITQTGSPRRITRNFRWLRMFVQLTIVSFTLLHGVALSQLPEMVQTLQSPAGEGSAQASLTVSPDGRVFLSWVEPAGEKRNALKFSILTDSTWSAPLVIAAGDDWFVNWADFPSMGVFRDGSMAAHWLARSGPDTYAYGVRISRSFDGGTTWTAPVTPHRDSTQTEHGFVSMFPAPGGTLGAVWLDGREMTGGEEEHDHGNMTLRYASLTGGGEPAGEAVLDDRVCECCQTSAAVTSDGPIIVYRDRLEGEVRDISTVRWTDGRWSRPRTVAHDGWKIDGCPVNGPAIDALDSLVVVAWFTAAGDTPRVKVAFSHDAGAAFDGPVSVDGGRPAGRVDVVLLDDGSAVVSWLERKSGGGEVMARRVRPDGIVDSAVTVAPSGTARSSGFPRMVRSGKRLIFSWIGEGVQTAVLPLR